VAALEGDGAGYDVWSCHADGTVTYVEVKTTRGPAETACFVSANELVFARAHAERYTLYRIYQYNPDSHTGLCYIITGSPEAVCAVVPTHYRLTPA
jgi:hypothetical protein